MPKLWYIFSDFSQSIIVAYHNKKLLNNIWKKEVLFNLTFIYLFQEEKLKKVLD